MPDTATETFVQQAVRTFNDRHHGEGFIGATENGYRTLGYSDLQEVAAICEEQLKAYEARWIERVLDYLNALIDLAGQAHDEEETSTPEDAISWAEAQFKDIFHIKEH